MNSDEKKLILETFNKQFCELVEDVRRIFPNDMTVSIMNKSLSILMMVNKKQIIQVYKTSTADVYSKEIENGDLSFFINKNYNEDVTSKGYSTDVVLEKIEYVKGLVKQMNEEEQHNVIKYFQNLTVLCKMYYANE